MSGERVRGLLRFTGVRLENWRNFRRVEVPLQRRMFIIGANASGKSNFIDAFRFLSDIVTVGGGFEAAVAREHRGSVSMLRCLAARQNPDIAISVDVGSDDDPEAWRYELRFGQDNQRRPVIKSEAVDRGGRTCPSQARRTRPT